MPLKFLVTVKRVEDPDATIRARPDGVAVVTDGVAYKVNPFDEVAIEEALRLRDKYGGEVVAVSIGGERSLAEIRTALAMGVERGILIRHDGALDPLVTSALLARVVEREKPDLCILGKQSTDCDQNQTGQYLAQRLGWPQATFASKTESLDGEAEERRTPGVLLSSDGHSMQVIREVDGGLETLEVLLPAVVTTDLRLNRPRFASLPGIMKAKRKELKEIPASELEVDLTPRVVVKRLAEPDKRKRCMRVADVNELWQKLHEEAKLL